jgi:hypothetical protein
MLDPVQNHWWIAPASLVALFVVRAVMVAAWGNHLQNDTIWFVAFSLVWVPYVVYLTLWCYAQPSAISQESLTYDLRVSWPFFALFYIVFACLHGRRVMRRRAWWRWSHKSFALREQANLLAAQGRIAEAEAAHDQADWILHNKLIDGFSK